MIFDRIEMDLKVEFRQGYEFSCLKVYKIYLLEKQVDNN